MLDKLEDLEKLRSAGNSRRMKSKISSMVEAVEYRSKLIMIAENSAAKWVVSDRYDHASQIADDSDDEKKIRQADAWAVRELEKQSRGRGRFQPYGRGRGSSSWSSAAAYQTAQNPTHIAPAVQSASLIPGGQAATFRPQDLVPIQPIQQLQPVVFPAPGQGFRQQAPRDICLLCDRRGHWRNQCPMRGQFGY